MPVGRPTISRLALRWRSISGPNLGGRAAWGHPERQGEDSLGTGTGGRARSRIDPSRAVLCTDEAEGRGGFRSHASVCRRTRNRRATIATVFACSTPTLSTPCSPVGALSCNLLGGVDRRYLAGYVTMYEFRGSFRANSVVFIAALADLHTLTG